MGNLIKGLKVAAYVAEIIVAGSVVIELAEKYCGKFGKKKIATGLQCFYIPFLHFDE